MIHCFEIRLLSHDVMNAVSRSKPRLISLENTVSADIFKEHVLFIVSDTSILTIHKRRITVWRYMFGHFEFLCVSLVTWLFCVLISSFTPPVVLFIIPVFKCPFLLVTVGKRVFIDVWLLSTCFL